jgi:hypothetical protein
MQLLVQGQIPGQLISAIADLEHGSRLGVTSCRVDQLPFTVRIRSTQARDGTQAAN